METFLLTCLDSMVQLWFGNALPAEREAEASLAVLHDDPNPWTAPGNRCGEGDLSAFTTSQLIIRQDNQELDF